MRTSCQLPLHVLLPTGLPPFHQQWKTHVVKNKKVAWEVEPSYCLQARRGEWRPGAWGFGSGTGCRTHTHTQAYGCRVKHNGTHL